MESFTIDTEEFLTQRRKDAKRSNGRGSSRGLHVFFASLLLCVFALIFPRHVPAQKVAVLAPDKTDASRAFAWDLENEMIEKVSIQDNLLAAAAFNAAAFGHPYNLTREQSRSVGAAIGCEYLILIRAMTLRRSSSRRPEYYEASASVFVVSSRSGRMVDWRLLRFEASKPAKAERMLAASIAPLARKIASGFKDLTKSELTEPPPAQMEEVPEIGSAAARNFRAPIPYRRLKPKYTSDAYLYDIQATVDIVIDLDASGSIVRTEVVRWAGYGLDESAESAVRAMNWRPAERNGKPLPMRFLVRYNFKKIEKQEDN